MQERKRIKFFKCRVCKETAPAEEFMRFRLGVWVQVTSCTLCTSKANAYYEKTKHQRKQPRKCKAAESRAHNKKWRDAALKHLGGCCCKCGFSDDRALQIDHVKSGGSKELRLNMGYMIYHKQVIQDTTGKYQLLCANCNWIKRYENDEHTKGKEFVKKSND